MSKLILQEINKVLENGKTAWLTTVIETEGSTPGKVGAKMLVNPDGSIVGTIGGGSVEMLVVQRILKERPAKMAKWDFDLGGGFDAAKTGMACGGRQEILIEPLFTAHDLYIVGGGHCGRALSELAAKCDFNVTVIDDRAECVTKESHPYASGLICTPYDSIDQHINFSDEIFIVVMTHRHKHDELVMRKVLGKPYKYLGVIGSKTKSAIVFKNLLRDNFVKDELLRVFMPIGFAIGSQTPHEIAVSIMAQLLAVKSDTNDIIFNANPL